MKIRTRVKAKVTNGKYKSLTIEDLNLSLFIDKRAYINDTPIPKEIGEDVIDHVEANTTPELHLHYVEYEANLTLDIEDYGFSLKQDRELLTVVFRGSVATLLTPRHEHTIRNADKLRETLRQKVSSYV